MARQSLTPFRPAGLAERGFGDPFLSLHREMDRLLDDVFRGRTGGPAQGGGMMMPDIDVCETDQEVRICAELPGVSEDDIDLSLSDDMLTIRGEKKFERKDEKENYHFTERAYGTFQRALRLPYPVDPDKVRADFDNGVLTVTLPKGPEQDRNRKIQVQRARRHEAAPGSSTEGGSGEEKRRGSAT